MDRRHDVTRPAPAAVPACDTNRIFAIVLCAIAGVLVVVLMIQVIAHFANAAQDAQGGCSGGGPAAQRQGTATLATAAAAPAVGGVTDVTDEAQLRAALQQNTVVVMFWATWCGACKHAKPSVLAASKKSPFTILAVEQKQNCAAALHKKHNVTAFPTFIRLHKKTGTVLEVMRGGGKARIDKFFGVPKE